MTRRHGRRQHPSAPAASFTLLDEDQTVLACGAETARQLAAQGDITSVWQGPCFEAVLLRHLPGYHTRRPSDTLGAGAALQRE